MKRILTIVSCLVLFGLNVASAQIPVGAPYPVEFKITAPSLIAGNYNYGTMSGWGDTLDHTICGQVVWVKPDSLSCDSLVNDYSGKIVAIRRGTCTFGQKVIRAQQAGAIGVIIFNHYTTATDNADIVYNMSLSNVPPFDSLSAFVTIPAVFLSRASGEQIIPALDAGQDVEACYYVPAYHEPNLAFAYATPKNEILELNQIGAKIFNSSPSAVTYNTKVDITDPLGSVTTLEATVPVSGLVDTTYTFTDSYLPTVKGVYSAIYTNDVTLDTLHAKFEITDSTFSIDNQVIDGYTAVAAADFSSAGLKFDVGSFFLTNIGGAGVATHAVFAIHNPDSFNTAGFDLILYDLDPDGDGQLPTNFDYANFSPVAFGSHTFNGTEGDDELLYVEFDPPVELRDTNAYLMMARYDGSNWGIGAVPQYSSAGSENYRNINTVVYGWNASTSANILFNAGWSSNDHNVVRLLLQNVVSYTHDLKPLDKDAVKLFPNPASRILNVGLEIENTASEVKLLVTNSVGSIVKETTWNNISKGNYPLNISELSNGIYFLTVVTPDGFRTKMFNVAK